MMNSNLNVSTSNLLDDINLLKAQKEKLLLLRDKMVKSKENLNNSHLSGKTFDESVKNNEMFIQEINTKISLFGNYIASLEAICGIYEDTISDISDSVRG